MEKTTWKIALGQMCVQPGEPAKNLATASALICEAAAQQADIVLLPELWHSGYDLSNAARYATPTDAGVFREIAGLAAAHHIAVFGSCLSEMTPGRYGNTAVFFDATGQAVGVYSKVHLFQLMQEHHHLTAGSQLTLINTPQGKIGLAICYDLRFPELFRAYALAGARAILLVAQWPSPRLAHWQTLLRARAIENQLYMIACNRVGTDGATHFFGHSTIVDPWGELIVEAGDTEILLTATIDLTRVEQVRTRIPVFADRQPKAYLSL